ncbi:MAG TPA: alpha-1,3-galactosidase B [Bacteroidales bacterium]|nr:alpha-1,3-galactosidase B [Bacteroidales bacterium]
MRKLVFLSALVIFLTGCVNQKAIVKVDVKPNTKENISPIVGKLIAELEARQDTTHLTVKFPKGTYHFYEEGAFTKEYYISNHDQDNPKKVGFALENLSNLTIDGQGSEFIFHGRMVPFSVIKGNNITLKNFSIDYEIPAFRQLTILSVDTASGVVEAEIYPAGHHRVDNGNRLIAVCEGYENPLFVSMGFHENRRLTYQRGDVSFDAKKIETVNEDKLKIFGWSQTKQVAVGDRYALRSYHRPTPGIFISECKDMFFENIKVHYAEGMGLLAQMSENITLDGFSVCLKGDNDPHYFTTQADATHFSACKGVIISKNALYEGMANDAINVHGTYLRITKRVNDNTLQGRYMHPQAYGFIWGVPGDEVQFVESEKMELVGDAFVTTIKEIKAIDKPTEFGAKEFEITFNDALPKIISEKGKFGVENLTWTPEVVFSDNVIRNNRARGALFSTPKKVVCENNFFDHTHGTAILLCGDCNGWYETGACREVIIRNNRFLNALTANYQFTNGIISIYPEIPNLKDQQKYFHSGVVIENNVFETFDRPLVYAKSIDGLIFRNNKIKQNNEFKPFHWNKHPFFFEKVKNVSIENNTFGEGFEFDAESDVRVEQSPENAVTVK